MSSSNAVDVATEHPFSPVQVIEMRRLDVMNNIANLIREGHDASFLRDVMKKDDNDGNNQPSSNIEPDGLARSKWTALERRPPPIVHDSPCIQRYDPTDLTKLVDTFDGKSDAATKTGISKKKIIDAIEKNVLLADLRWFQVARDQRHVPQTIPETQTVERKNKDYIAQLNLEKTIVVGVHKDAKSAAISQELGRDGITYAMRKLDGVKNGFFWTHWSELNTTVRDTFEGEMPELVSANCIKKVEQIDPDTGEVVKTWDSMDELASSSFKICHKSQKLWSENMQIKKGFRWRVIED